jgi:hypothetical protein
MTKSSTQITEFGTARTAEQRLNMQQVIDWLARGAPHTSLKDGGTLTGFDYSSYIIPAGYADRNTGQCGTVGCIAGAAVQFDSPVPVSDGNVNIEFSVQDKARALLGLSYEESGLLFYPFNLEEFELQDMAASISWDARNRHMVPLELGFDDMVDYHDDVCTPLAELEFASPQQIARVLQHFQDTGVIDWRILED